MSIAVTVTHTKTLVNPSTGSDDKVYGSDYVSASSHAGTWGGSDASFASAVLTLGGSTPGAGYVATGGTITASSPLFSGTQTWNNAAVAFTGIFLNFTNTNASSAKLFDFQKDGFSALRLDGLESTAHQLTLLGGNGAAATFEIGSRSQSIRSFVVGPGLSNALGVISGYPIGWSSSATNVYAGLDSAHSRISAGLIGVGTGAQGSFAGRLKLTSTITAAVAVASLNASPTIGEVQTVNDALAVTVKGATVANGGSAVCQVMWNGSNWVGI